MKAILLAAGLGTRLKPITNRLPKCLVPINGKPLLGYWIDILVNLGVKEILINLHHFSAQVEKFVAASPYHDKITLVKEERLLGTAGTLVVNKNFWCDETVIVIHADNFCSSNLQELLVQHRKRVAKAIATLLIFETDSPESCGVVELDDDGIVQEFYEKVANPPGNWASGALFVFSPDVYDQCFSNFVSGQFYELSVDVVPRMLGKLQSWKVDGYYQDIGSPKALEETEHIVLGSLA